MMRIIVTLVLATVAIALPQAPKAAPPADKPTATNPTPTTPRPLAVGQLPTDGIRGLPWPGFEQFGSQLGFDPAKATPDPSG